MLVFLQSIWKFLTLSAPYLLLGLFVAGIVHHILPLSLIKKLFGGRSLGALFKAAILGVPLPLCSCSVIPTAVELKKSGASNASTSSFLIATPESGIDSISVTYALMDLPMTILRPVAAFCSAFFAGILQFIFNNEYVVQEDKEEKKSCCSKSHSHSHAHSSDSVEPSFAKKLKSAIRYGYFDLVEDIAVWMSAGIIISALIDVFIPAGFFGELSGWSGRFLMILVGIPMYICASASTPVAAAMIMKGMSPGMALIFLLVGPATNISNILVLQKYIGKKGVWINMFSIAFMAVVMAFITDWAYESFQWPVEFLTESDHKHGHLNLFENICASILSFLLLRGVFKAKFGK